MTVQELIDELQKVEDKGQPVYYPFGPNEVEVGGVSPEKSTRHDSKTREPYQATRPCLSQIKCRRIKANAVLGREWRWRAWTDTRKHIETRSQ